MLTLKPIYINDPALVEALRALLGSPCLSQDNASYLSCRKSQDAVALAVNALENAEGGL